VSAPESFVIVGGGQAGGRAAEAMRAAGFGGAITILGDEPVRPYERPPLSKGVLTGDAGDDAVYLRAPDDYDAQGITVRPGARRSATTGCCSPPGRG
jgi:3-phenylpropionate/trans-cinnamate dioxygenase ferredoxin reductase subunit